MNLKPILGICLISLSILSACKNGNQSDSQSNAKTLIEKPTLDLSGKRLTPEILWGMGKLTEFAVSPDGNEVIYAVSYYNIEENKGNGEIYKMNTDGSQLIQLTKTPKSEFNIQWNPNKKRIGFLRGTETGAQLFEMDTDGKNEKQITDIEGGLQGFKYSPDGSKILYVQMVPKDKEFENLYKGLDKTTGRINEDLMYRHWDEWVDHFPHVFVADFNGSALSNNTDLMKGEAYETPMRPFGGMEQITWSPDSKTIAYTCRKKKGKDYSLSTNSDIYLYSLENKTTQNICESMLGYDMNPVFSPDGKKIAWLSMEHDGYEADKTRLFVHDFETKISTYLTPKFDQNASSICWAKDGKTIYFISPWHGVEDIYNIDLASQNITRLTNGTHDYMELQMAKDGLIATQMSMSLPTELFSVDLKSFSEKQISFVNKEVLEKLDFGKVEARWIKTTDNKEMLTWIIYPPHFDSTKAYPTLLYCQGGPQTMVGQFWSTRWNFQLMAANDYIIVAPNRHGVPGFGTAWNEQISGDYGGQCMRDYLSAIDAMAKEPFVDKDHLGAVGASFGGYSVYWLAGHHNKRFKAFIAHNGMFNLEQQYLETEEMWFVNWDLGGPYWDKTNKIAQSSYANSPHKFVDKWDTPLLVIHSELDFRIVASQGMAAYNAALLKGIPARYLYFPDENHWVVKPQNSILWHRNFFDWLDKWLKPAKK